LRSPPRPIASESANPVVLGEWTVYASVVSVAAL